MGATRKHFFLRSICLPLLTLLLVLSQASAAFAATFPDVQEGSRYYDVVEENASKGYVIGFDDGLFHPEVTLDRVQGALIFSRILMIDTSNLDEQYFKDVPKNYRFYKEVSGVARQGVIKGFPDGTFRLHEPLTRGQVALIIYRTFPAFQTIKNVNLPFTDAKGTVYEEAVGALYATGVTEGKSSTYFGVNDTIIRGDFLILLTKAMEVIHGDKTIKDVHITVNQDQSATISGHINNINLDGTEVVNIKVYPKGGTNHIVHVDAKPDAKQFFTTTTQPLAAGDYTAKVGVVGSKHTVSKDFTVTDTAAPAAVGISFKDIAVIDRVVDLLDLKTDLHILFTYGTTVPTGAEAGDILSYTISSDDYTITETVTLTQADIERGHVEVVLQTNALQNLLGGLLDDGLGGLLGGSLSDLLTIVPASNGEVMSAGLLDGGLLDLGELLGGVTNTLGGLLDGLLGGNDIDDEANTISKRKNY